MTTDPNVFDVGPTPPAWTLPGAQPNWDSLTEDGASVLGWTRDFGDQVWIETEDVIKDGQWVRSPAAIVFCEPPRDGVDAAGARQLAAQLLNAADTLDQPAINTTPTTRQGQLALSLAQLRLCERDLTAAHNDAAAAAAALSGARHGRAVELAELIADAIAFVRRLAVVVEGDLRAEDATS